MASSRYNALERLVRIFEPKKSDQESSSTLEQTFCAQANREKPKIPVDSIKQLARNAGQYFAKNRETGTTANELLGSLFYKINEFVLAEQTEIIQKQRNRQCKERTKNLFYTKLIEAIQDWILDPFFRAISCSKSTSTGNKTETSSTEEDLTWLETIEAIAEEWSKKTEMNICNLKNNFINRVIEVYNDVFQKISASQESA